MGRAGSGRAVFSTLPSAPDLGIGEKYFYRVGSSVPQNTGLAFPGPFLDVMFIRRNTFWFRR